MPAHDSVAWQRSSTAIRATALLLAVRFPFGTTPRLPSICDMRIDPPLEPQKLTQSGHLSSLVKDHPPKSNSHLESDFSASEFEGGCTRLEPPPLGCVLLVCHSGSVARHGPSLLSLSGERCRKPGRVCVCEKCERQSQRQSASCRRRTRNPSASPHPRRVSSWR